MGKIYCWTAVYIFLQYHLSDRQNFDHELPDCMDLLDIFLKNLHEATTSMFVHV